MESLHKEWFTDGLIDFEYKKYILLAYLKTVDEKFSASLLYPYLGDLVFHYQNILHFKKNKELLYENFPKKVTRADFEKLKLSYKKIIDDDEMMEELERIVSFAIPKFKSMLESGKNLYEYIEKHINIEPVGLSPIYQREGYLFLANDTAHETQIYKYQVTILNHTGETYHAVHTSFVECQVRNLAHSYEHMKLQLVRRFSQLPNPATYLVMSKIKVPFKHTLLPVAKRMLVQYLSRNAA